MLIEDTSVDIIPIPGYTSRAFEISLQPQDAAAESLIVAGLSRANGSYRDELASVAYDFLKECTWILMGSGEAAYEIAYLSERATARDVGFELVRVQSGTYRWHRGSLVQVVPEDVAESRGIPREIRVEADQALHFEIPGGMKRRYLDMIESLEFIDKNPFPRFALDRGAAGLGTPFDSSLLIRTQKMALADATRLVGWNARGTWQEDTLDYYWVWRELAFELFKAELRNLVLLKLNEGLTVAGHRLGFSSRLEIKGLPSVQDVEQARKHLANGDLPFGEILKPFRFL
jgi:hypothetical protein